MTTILPSSFGNVRSRKRKSPRWFFALLGVATLLVLCVIIWRNQTTSLFLTIAKPVLMLRGQLGQDRISELEAELASTSAALADRNALYQQTLELKQLMGRPKSTTQILAAVLVRPPATPYDTLILDVGKGSGVAVGQLVYAGGAVAIGDVTEVYDSTSRVTLFSAPGRNYDALVQLTATPGSVLPVGFSGQGAGSLVGQVPAGSKVRVGDSVIIPGIGSAFMGTINYVEATEGSSFETLYLTLPANIFSLHYVQIQTHL